MESSRRRNRERSARPARLDQILEHLMEKRRERILLQPLRQTGRERQTALAGLQSQTFLPSDWDDASAGQISLRAERSKGMAFERRSHRRRALSQHHGPARDRSEEPDLLQEPGRSELQSRRAARYSGRRIRVYRQR